LLEQGAIFGGMIRLYSTEAHETLEEKMDTSIPINQLLPTLQTLPRLDKLRLVPFLIS